MSKPVNRILRWIEVPGLDGASFCWNRIKSSGGAEYDPADMNSGFKIADVPKYQDDQLAPVHNAIGRVTMLLHDLTNRVIVRWHYDVRAGLLWFDWKEDDRIHRRELDDTTVLVAAHECITTLSNMLSSRDKPVSAPPINL